jgi:hypothetical protein
LSCAVAIRLSQSFWTSTTEKNLRRGHVRRPLRSVVLSISMTSSSEPFKRVIHTTDMLEVRRYPPSPQRQSGPQTRTDYGPAQIPCVDHLCPCHPRSCSGCSVQCYAWRKSRRIKPCRSRCLALGQSSPYFSSMGCLLRPIHLVFFSAGGLRPFGNV